MRFRSYLILTISGVLLLIVFGMWAATGRVLENSAQIRLTQEVDRDIASVIELLKTRREILEGEVSVVAAEPRLKAITAAQDVSHETVFGVAAELKKALGSDVFLLTDADGSLIVDTADPEARGFDLGGEPLIAGALKNARAEGIWTHEKDVYLMQSQRLAFGTRTA
jgi:sigma-B regulation protein RsbU (phosphoserine phosphatase)